MTDTPKSRFAIAFGCLVRSKMRDLTLKQAAFKVYGVESRAPQLSRTLNGKGGMPTERTISRFCKAFDIDYDEIERLRQDVFEPKTPIGFEPPVFVDETRVRLLLEAEGASPDTSDLRSPRSISLARDALVGRGCILLRTLLPRDWDANPELTHVEETCTAQRYECMRRSYGEKRLFDFWVSESVGTHGERRVLLLLSGASVENDETKRSSYSAFTALLPLIHECREELNQSAVSAHIPDDPFPDEHAVFGQEEDHPEFLAQSHNMDHAHFAKNWRNYLLRVGFIPIGNERVIETVYRIRFCDRSQFQPEGATALDFHIYGYPLWILDKSASER